MSPSTVFCRSSIYNLVFFIFVRDCTIFPWTRYTACTNIPWTYILLMLHSQNIDFRVLFWTFPQTGFSKLSGCVITRRQKSRFFTQRPEIQGICLILMAPELWYYHGCMWSVCHFELDTLSEWIKSIGDEVKRRIRLLKHSVNTRSESFFRDPDVAHELSCLHENSVIVPADKASNNYTFVCKKHYDDILIEELGLHSIPWNPTYSLTDFSAPEVFDNHKSALTSFGIQTDNE